MNNEDLFNTLLDATKTYTLKKLSSQDKKDAYCRFINFWHSNYKSTLKPLKSIEMAENQMPQKTAFHNYESIYSLASEQIRDILRSLDERFVTGSTGNNYSEQVALTIRKKSNVEKYLVSSF